MVQVFVFNLAGGAVYNAEFYGFNGTSIMESVMLRSGALLHSPLVYMNESNHGFILLYSKMQDPSLFYY